MGFFKDGFMDFFQFHLNAKELFHATTARPCHHCGACCRGFSIEILDADARREPRLLDYATVWENVPARLQTLYRPCPWVILTDGRSCPFLSAQNHCVIYVTRPLICRRVKPCIMACHIARLEERGLRVVDFLETLNATHTLDPSVFAGVLLAIDPESATLPARIPGGPLIRLDLESLVSVEYFAQQRKKL